MVESVRVQAPAKVNLALLVGGVDQSGYHELGTVFQAVSIFDRIEVKDAPAGVFELAISGPGQDELPTDDRNLAIRAARTLAGHCKVTDRGVAIRIHKQIPIAAGMAGGSADAAGTLVACSQLWGLELEHDELVRLGAVLGADVPFCVLGGTAIGRARGDLLTPVRTTGKLHWVFATSAVGLSTPEVFRRFDQLSPARSTTLGSELLAGLETGDVSMIAGNLTNDLELAALDLRPELAEVLDRGREVGALGGLLSGSGPTCAFLVSDADAAEAVSRELRKLPQVKECFLALGPVPGARAQGWQAHQPLSSTEFVGDWPHGG